MPDLKVIATRNATITEAALDSAHRIVGHFETIVSFDKTPEVIPSIDGGANVYFSTGGGRENFAVRTDPNGKLAILQSNSVDDRTGEIVQLDMSRTGLWVALKMLEA